MHKNSSTSSSSLTDLPVDELIAYGRDLGLTIRGDAPRGELLRRIRARQEQLMRLDREALLDVVAWARVPVRRSSSKEELAKHIASIEAVRFDGLSQRGLRALAVLRELRVETNDSRGTIEHRLRRSEGFWGRYRRRRRRAIGSLISKVLRAAPQQGEYRFLPEEGGARSLKQSIEEAGVVGGIAQKLRGAADEYVHQKLDEIEQRIDRKLDDIDGRLAEWRDQEIKNRLRIVKITLIAAIIVAVVSLGYDYVKSRSQAGAYGVAPTAAAETIGDVE